MTSSLTGFIERHRDEIMAVSLAKLHDNHPDVRSEALVAHMGAFLDATAALLRVDENSVAVEAPARSTVAARHGEQRWRLALGPATVVHDYGVMCDSVFELAGRQHLSIEPRDIQVFNRCIDSASADAITAYWQQDIRAAEEERLRQVGMLAHELRNALGSARMAFGLIQEGRAAAHGPTAAIVTRALDSMTYLVARALDEARVGGTMGPLQRSAVILPDLIDRVIAGSALERGVKIVFAHEGRLELEGDERLLESAISNLVQNAVKFTRPNGVVHVRAADVGYNIVIEIEDECGGLPDGAADELFAPFIQRGSDRRGVGLGLVVVREAVHAHGGQVGVRNVAGRGCVFFIELRCLRLAAPPSMNP